jgi:hypothetical protein
MRLDNFLPKNAWVALATLLAVSAIGYFSLNSNKKVAITKDGFETSEDEKQTTEDVNATNFELDQESEAKGGASQNISGISATGDFKATQKRKQPAVAQSGVNIFPASGDSTQTSNNSQKNVETSSLKK